ncbi:MAG: tetratricopeptide repeat protein [Verrucomicrobiota bacterium]
MKTRFYPSHFLPLPAFFMGAAILLVHPFQGEAQDLQELYIKASGLAQAGNFQEALATYDLAITNEAEFAWEDYGPLFGGLYYDRGICLLQLKRYQESGESFRICHDDYPPANKVPYGSRKKAPKQATVNRRWELAVFQLGYCQQMEGDHQAALDSYQKFTDLKPDPAILKSVYSAYVLRRAQCLLGLGRLDEGQKEITQIFDDPAKFKATGQLLFQAMLDLALGWVKAANDGGDQKALAERANVFLDQYGPVFAIGPYDKHRLGFVDRLRFAGYQAQRAGLNILALRFFAMAPTTQAVLADLETRAAQTTGPSKARYEQEMAAVKAKLESSDPPELETLRLLAASWEGLGNRRAGYVISRHLVERYPSSASMPELLHEAARYSFAIGDANSAQYYGEVFMSKYPNHELRENVSTFMLQSLFRNRKYQLCLDVAGRQRNEFPEGDPARELADFIYGASLYYLNRQEEAEEALAMHTKNYPDSGNRESVRFFQSSNKIILGKFSEAAPLLDSFLKDYPASNFRDQALFDRATAHYMVDEYADSLATLSDLISSFPESSALSRAFILQGDNYRAQAVEPAGDKEEDDYWKEAQVSYGEALAAAESRNQTDFRAESLYKTVDVSTDLEDWEKAVEAYDAFLPTHRGNTYEPQLSVFAMPALQAVGRTDDGLTQLERMIQELSAKDDVELLGKAIGSYQNASKEARGYDGTLSTYDQMISNGNTSLQTQLLIHKIMLFQEQLKAAKTDGEKAKFQSEVQSVFDKLSGYKMDELSDPALAAIGRNFEESNPFKAKPFFEALLDREDDLYKAPAEMALGRIEMNAKNVNAIQRFKRVIEYAKDPRFEAQKLAPEAHVGIGAISVQSKDWETAAEYLKVYIGNKRWDSGNKGRRAEAQYLYGFTLEQQGDLDGAIQVYNALFGAYPGYPQWSAKGVERGFDISYNRETADPEQEREKKIQAYTVLRIAIYTWQRIEEGAFEEVDRIRNLRDRVEGELGLTAQEIEAIELKQGIKQP